MATQSRTGANKRQGKGAGRAGAARRRARASGVSSPTTAAAGSTTGSVAVSPGRQPGTGESGAAHATRAARKQQSAPVSQGRFAGRTEGLRKTIADTRAELRRVNWPDKETTQNLTLVVIAISVVLGILLGGIDFVLFQIFEAIT